ncbi:hypothetical protein JOQ06_028426, partial [Pogonophryne albipinna]
MAGHEWFEREELIGQISDIRVQNLQEQCMFLSGGGCLFLKHYQNLMCAVDEAILPYDQFKFCWEK